MKRKHLIKNNNEKKILKMTVLKRIISKRTILKGTNLKKDTSEKEHRMDYNSGQEISEKNDKSEKERSAQKTILKRNN